jgi:hypothetical protein
MLSLWPLSAAAQAAVLIGLHTVAGNAVAGNDNEGINPPSYRTVLITFKGGKAQLAADIPDLIVPRKDGFWRVGSLHKGPYGGGYQEFIYVSPVRAAPHAVGEYHPPNPDYQGCDRTDQATIEFANPELMSVSYMHAVCGSLELQNGRATYTLDDPERPLDIKKLLGPAAWAALQKADAGAKASDDRLEDCPGLSPPSSTNWGIERSSQLPGSFNKDWILVGDFDSPHVCNDGYSYEIKFPIPESFIGKQYKEGAHLSLSKSASAKQNGINSNEAVLTPMGDFLIDFSPSYDPIKVFRVNGLSLGNAPVLSLSGGSTGEFNVVLLQWAIGKHVGQWESELKAIASSPLKEPILSVGAQQ